MGKDNDYSKYFAEAIGGFLLTFIGSLAVIVYGGATIAQFGPASLLAIALAHGLALAIIVYSVGHISGAHANPAVTIGFFALGKITLPEAAKYIVSQLAGAAAAGLALGFMFAKIASAASYGAPLPAASFGTLHAIALEAILTSILMFVVLATAADKRATPGWHGFAIGMTLAAAIIIGGVFTGGSLNPARSFGPAIAAVAFGDTANAALSSYWIYVIGPVLGGIIGAFGYRYTIAAKS
jgi:glycerol uptake facilitator protein